MKTNFPYLIAILFWMPLFSFAGPNGGVGTASNPLNGDTTGAGSVARQREIYEADFAAKQGAAFESQRTYQEQLASLKLLQDNLDDLNRPNGGGLFRSVHGETNYIYDILNNWNGVNGKVIQTLPDGILVKPEYGTDVFIEGYPFQTVDEQQLGECRAKEDGVYSYTAVSGGRRTVKKMNYGVTAIPSTELLEREINLVKLQILNHPVTVKLKHEADVRQKLAVKVRQAREHALKLDQDKAEKGDAVGLRRMGERYRGGDGVEKDAMKSAAFLKKADEADEIEIQKINAEKQAAEEEQKQKKFAWAIDQAEKGGVSGMILAGKCYRDGVGVAKDLSKATEYFRKAENAGSSEAAQLIETCK